MESAAIRKNNLNNNSTYKKKNPSDSIIFLVLCGLVVVFLAPILFIVVNSFKGKFFISDNPFSFPTAETFVGITNYINGLERTGFLSAIGWSFFITILSVLAILLFTSILSSAL